MRKIGNICGVEIFAATEDEDKFREVVAITLDAFKVTEVTRPDLLNVLISIINPKEKPTADRLRKLNARRKEYTEEEIIAAATEFSKSTWHKENKQMSIDNLLAPSKFGRWYAQSQETTKRKFA